MTIEDDLGGGFFASFLLSFPIGFLDLQLAFDNSLLGFLFFPFLPYVAFVVVSVVLYRLKRRRMGKGMLIGGVISSTLIVAGIVLFEIALLSAIGG